MKSVGNFITAFVLSLAVYLLLSGQLGWIDLAVGGGVSLVVAVLSLKYFPLPIKYLNPVRWFWVIVYIPFFIKEMVVANFHIARIVIDPRLPIHPELKKGRTELTTPEGKWLLTSSITLTPGTLSVDLNGDELEIHCVDTRLSAREIMQTFEKYIRRITE